MKKKIIEEINALIEVVGRVEKNLAIDGYNLERIKERLEELKRKVRDGGLNKRRIPRNTGTV